MLPEIGASELLVIAVVALLVVGPKDLPVLLRKLGQWVAKMRGMASEFRASFDEMARQSELDDLRREVEAMRSGQFTNPLHQATGGVGEAGVDQVFSDIESSLGGGGMQLHPPMSHQFAAPAEPEAAAEKPKRKRAPARPKAVAVAEVAAPPPAPQPRARRRKPAESAS